MDMAETATQGSLRYARWLFGCAGVVNLTVGAALLFLRGWFAGLIHLDPAHGTNLVFTYFAGVVIGLFGYAYIRLAIDPVRFRPYIGLSIAGKLLAVAVVVTVWLRGEITATLPMLISIDAVFSILFLDFLRRTA